MASDEQKIRYFYGAGHISGADPHAATRTYGERVLPRLREGAGAASRA